MAMQFNQVMAQFASGQTDDLWFEVPTGWGQGRAVFGGMASALALQHLLQLVPAASQLRSLSVSFVAPLNAGPAEVKRKVLRQGSSVVQAMAEIQQQGQTMLVLLASFGTDRNSNYQQAGIPAPVWQTEVVSLPKHGPVPEFTTHFDYQIQQGTLPFRGSQQPSLGGQIRFSAEQQYQAGYAELLALIDAWPPVSLTLLTAPAMASSLTWTVEFVGRISQYTTTDWWRYLANIEYAADGYHHIEAKLWDPSGQLLAISRQTVTVFA
jgi:acyl-CoA thioesterase